MRIVWDEAKRLTNLAKHGLDFADLDIGSFSQAALGPTDKGRFVAIGEWAEITITVVFRPLGAEAISVISMRPATERSEDDDVEKILGKAPFDGRGRGGDSTNDRQ